ncbi:elongation factor 4 [bacterium]|nr:MAG: elongation factor 4 [bacterium]
MNQSTTRNFCIIAHIDHGKSTLADRMLELTGTVDKRHMQAQLLDSMDLEREKGITIKLQPVRMQWTPRRAQSAVRSDQPGDVANVGSESDGSEQTDRVHSHESGLVMPQSFTLNLIDTPGHVDFSYEVSRSLAACEGAVLVVDASQGIQAQTLANVYLAIEAGLEIIPVLNKIDLPAADPERVAGEVASLLGCEPTTILRVSGKTGEGVSQVLDAIVEQIPPPKGDPDAPLRALIFDSIYDTHRGVILFVRITDGRLRRHDDLVLMAAHATGLAVEVGTFAPKQTPAPEILTGQIGYVVTNLKSISEARVGDTVTLEKTPATIALDGYRQVKPFVFAGFFPSSGEQYPALKDALEKLKLNDAALLYEPETSQVLGFGYRVGFLGLLHLEIIKERLEREYNLDMVVTSPSTDYIVVETDGTERTIRSAAELPDPSRVDYIREPWISGEVVVPKAYVGGVIQLINRIRGLQNHLSYLDESLALISFEAPLANVLTDFYDSLKSITSGYGSFNYELADYRREKLVRLDILVSGELIDSLSMIAHAEEAYRAGKQIVEKLKEVIPRQNFEISLQAAIGAKSSPAKMSKPCAKTSLPSSTAAMSPAKTSSSTSKRRAKRK